MDNLESENSVTINFIETKKGKEKRLNNLIRDKKLTLAKLKKIIKDKKAISIIDTEVEVFSEKSEVIIINSKYILENFKKYFKGVLEPIEPEVKKYLLENPFFDLKSLFDMFFDIKINFNILNFDTKKFDVIFTPPEIEESYDIKVFYDDALNIIMKNKNDFFDDYNYDNSFIRNALIWSILRTSDIKLEDLTLSKSQIDSYLKDEKHFYTLEKNNTITNPKFFVFFNALYYKPLRYKIQHDTVKIISKNRNFKSNDPVDIIENMSKTKTTYYLSEKEKKPLNIYHNIALFDLLLRMLRTKQIKKYFVVVKGNEKISKEDTKNIAIIDNNLIKTFLNVDDKIASRIKKSIYDLSDLVLVIENENYRYGVYPIRKTAFIEDKENNKRIDVFEIDKLLYANSKNYLTLKINPFLRIKELDASSREKEFIQNVYLYILNHSNLKNKRCYINAKSYSEDFDNNYAQRREWNVLKNNINNALNYLRNEAKLIEDYKENGDSFIVYLEK
ncbi:hypothetical protein, partial [Marinitoga sp. 38H-ov]|uniref:hypothetical protein n=1 Tax=Marinitoga sp. 38H-ov TaxID=1755814 RepID=UPI0013EE3D5B